MTGSLAFVVPGRLDQLTGGYLYDRHVVDGLRAHGREVELIELPGLHPEADAGTREAAGAALARLADGRAVVVDGLALPALADCLPAEARRLRLVGFIHHPLSLETGLAPACARERTKLESRLWPRLAGALCPSHHTARAVVASGLSPSRVAVVAPGTHRPVSARPAAQGGPLQLLAVGTVTPRKGHLLLVDALAPLRHLDWQLTCIGSLTRDPAAASALQERIARHGLGERIALLGEQPEDLLAQAYQQAQIFVLPSYHEGYGMVYAEALAYGLPVVATTGGALTDTLPASASLRVAPGDLPALQAALRQLLTDGGLRDRLAAGARRAAAHLPDWPSAVRSWMAALEQVLQ